MRRCRSTLQAGTCDAQATTVLRPQNQRNHTSRGTQGNCPLWKPTRRSTALTSAAPMSAGPPPRRLVKAKAHALQTHRRVGWLLADPVLHARASARSGWPGRLSKPASSTAATRSQIPAIWYAMHHPHRVRILCDSNAHKRIQYCQRFVTLLINVTTFDVRQAAPRGAG